MSVFIAPPLPLFHPTFLGLFHPLIPHFLDYSGIYDLATVAAKQAAIVAALYSARLTMIVTVYTNEIVFWDSDEGNDRIIYQHILINSLMHAFSFTFFTHLFFTFFTHLLTHSIKSSAHPLLLALIDRSFLLPSLLPIPGTIVKRIEAEDLGRTDAAVDITSAVLDDRERKVVTGDSSGVVSVYNCATAVKIKSFPPIPSSVQYVMYTPDKTILVIGANGGLYVYDDRLTDVKEVRDNTP